VASEQISNEYIGSGSIRRIPPIASGSKLDSNGEIRPVGLDSPMKTRPALSARARAGQVLVEEVMLGVLDSVSSSPSPPLHLLLPCLSTSPRVITRVKGEQRQ
jgi:serine/threonine-protein kinase 24/25/MST4